MWSSKPFFIFLSFFFTVYYTPKNDIFQKLFPPPKSGLAPTATTDQGTFSIHPLILFYQDKKTLVFDCHFCDAFFTISTAPEDIFTPKISMQ
jgi:hypothetical protein